MRLKRHLLLAAVLVALGAGAAAGYLLNGRGSEPSFVDTLVFIPTVMGETEREAIAALDAQGLKAHITYERHAPSKFEGRVIGQQQPSARFTSRGSTIRLIVAR
jgi:beta-lactam-binding protein with PASTA domain